MLFKMIPSSSVMLLQSDQDAIERLLLFATGGEVPSAAVVLLTRVLGAVVIAGATALVSYLVCRLVRNALAKLNDSVPTTIFVNIVRVGVWCVGIAIILSACFNVDPTGIVAALGVGGIALSLGLQDTISNIIGGLQLSTMGTLKKGDHVIVGSTEGIVEDVAWRETTIRGFSGERTIVPNKVLNSNALTVLPPARKVKVPVQIPNETVEAFRGRGVMADDMGKIIAQAITDRLIDPAPEGMGLSLQHDAILQFGCLTDFAASATVIVWIEEGVEFDRFEVISAIAASAADACSVDARSEAARSADAPTVDTRPVDALTVDACPADVRPTSSDSAPCE